MKTLRDLVPRPRRVSVPVTVGVIGFFVVGLFSDELRPNLIAEAWGVLGAGVVVWWVLEPKSEEILHRTWLLKNAERLEGSLRQILQAAQTTARSVAVALPTESQSEAGSTPFNLTWVDAVRLMLNKVRRETIQSRWMLGRLPDLELAIHRYTEASELLLTAYSDFRERQPFDIGGVPVTRRGVENDLLVLHAEATSLSHACSNLLKEIGAKPM